MSNVSTSTTITANIDANQLRPGAVLFDLQGIPHMAVADDVELENLEKLEQALKADED